MLVIMDDLFFCEDPALQRRASRELCASLSKLYGDLRYETEPSSFKGYSIRQDRPVRLLQLTMPQKIDEAARAHLPELLDGGALPRLPAGRRLADIADGLALVSPLSRRLRPSLIHNKFARSSSSASSSSSSSSTHAFRSSPPALLRHIRAAATGL
jgi:hypothetical protein